MEFQIKPSKEQQEIIDALLNQENVLVNAVAGAGKTTQVLLLAKQTKDRILHLTYNALLKDETKAKVKQYKIENLSVMTFHGCATWINKKTGKNKDIIHNNEKLETFLREDFNLPNDFNYKYLIIDEAQDLDVLLVLFLKRIYAKFKHKPTVLVLGDKRQSINQFKKASSVFLTNIDEILKIPMIKKKLTTSFRVPDGICQSLNQAFIKVDNWMNGYEKGGKNIFYLNLNYLQIAETIIEYIKDKKQNENAKPDDFFILSFGVSNNYALHEIENYLIKYFTNNNWKDWAVFYPKKDADSAYKDDKELKNKIVFSTINQAKGRERKYVILPLFDVEYYSAWLKADKMYDQCINEIPNLHYVALTRCKKENLIFLQTSVVGNKAAFDNINLQNKSRLFPYINYQKLTENEANIIHGKKELLLKPEPALFCDRHNETTNYLKLLASKAGDYLPHDVESELMGLIQPLLSQETTKFMIDIKNEITDDNKHLYSEPITILNSFYLLQNYLFENFKDQFVDNMKNYCLQIKNWQISYLQENPTSSSNTKTNNKNLESLRFQLINTFDLDEINNNPIKWYKHTELKIRLKFYNIWLALSEDSDTSLQLPHYNWLDEFNDYKTINKLFKQFKINDILYEQPIDLSYDLTDEKTNKNYYAVIKLFLSKHKKRRSLNEKSELHVLFNSFLEDLNAIVEINARIDLINKDMLFELKCINQDFNLTHYLQIIIYMWLINHISQTITAYTKHLKINYFEDDNLFLKQESWTNDENRFNLNYLELIQNLRKQNHILSKKEQLYWLKKFLWIKNGIASGVLINYRNGKICYVKNDKVLIEKIVKKIIDFKLHNLGEEMDFKQVMDELKQKEQEFNM